MGQASKFLRSVSGAWERDPIRRGFGHWCPACEEMHVYWTEGDRQLGPVWTFNGNVDLPSFSPSMRITYNGKDADQDRGDGFGRAPHACCHYFVQINGGQSVIAYCGDSSHSLAGKTVPLPELPPHLRDG